MAPGGDAETEGGGRGRRRRPARGGGVEERGGGGLLEGGEVGGRGGLAERLRRLLVDLWEKTSGWLEELERVVRGRARGERGACLVEEGFRGLELGGDPAGHGAPPARADWSGGAGWWIAGPRNRRPKGVWLCVLLTESQIHCVKQPTNVCS